MQNVLLKALSRALVVLGLCGSVAHAQDRVKELAEYQGADRQVRLIEAAKKENGITVYHAYPALSNVMTAFTKKYGIKTRAWRAGSEAVLQRLITEARGNRFEVDIVQNNAPGNEAAHREKLLQAVRSPLFADLIPQAVPAHGEWTGITLDVWIAAYNTSRVSEEELPKRYEDLQDPKWKGRLGIEVPLALTVYNWNPEQMKSKGAPIKGLALKPVIAQPSTVALLKNAPNPASAILFYDFIISEEGQRILQDFSYVTTHKRLPHPLRDASLKYIDPAKAIDMQTAWLSNFDEMIVKKAK